MSQITGLHHGTMEISLPVCSLFIIAGVAVFLLNGNLLLTQNVKKHLSISLMACLSTVYGLSVLHDFQVTPGISNEISSLLYSD